MGSATPGPPSNKAHSLGAPLAFLDESGVRRSPTRRRTWAPEGQTPMVPYSDRPDRIAARAALTVSPTRQPRGLDIRFQRRHFQALDGADFLRALWRPLRGHIILRWDRGSLQRGPALEAICPAHPRRHLEAFPADVPELNPAEQIGNDFTGHPAHSRLRETRD
jgi:hypothetical protein